MKKILTGILIGIFFVGIGHAFSESVSIEPIGRLKVWLYVFNDKTQLWDRAREETVKNITCDKLRGFGLPTSEEYHIEIERIK